MALHNIAEIGFTSSLGPAQVLEIVKEEFPFHKQAAGGNKREVSSTLEPAVGHVFVEGSAPKILSSCPGLSEQEEHQ